LTEVGVVLVAAVAGILGSMLGLGGGVFIVPILSLFFGVPLKTAIAASAISVVVNSIGGASVYLKHRLTNVHLALVMEVTTTIGAIVGGLVVVLISTNVLRFVFGALLLAMAAVMVLRGKEADPVTEGSDRLQLKQRYHDPAIGGDVTYIPQHVAVGMAASSVAGVISGLLGIGGGAVKVPIMNTIMRVPVKAAAATSIWMVGMTVSTSSFIYYTQDLIDLSVTVPALFGILIGSQIGSRYARRARSKTMVRILIVILAYLAINLLLQAFGIELPGAR
jgi:uncharacterized membrane protein YfcA